jgi:D-amino-acid oxidase
MTGSKQRLIETSFWGSVQQKMNKPRRQQNHVVVVGCGVVGLTSAIRLQEDGYSVRIVARDLPPWTTSNKAAAIWEPYLAEPKKKVEEWAAATYTKYAGEYENQSSGISEVELIEVGKKPLVKPPWIRSEYKFRSLSKSELPEGYVDGFGVCVPFIHSTVYLDYLLRVFASNGGDVQARTLSSLADLGAGIRWVVNCSGLGARELVHDQQVFGIRGQLAIVSVAGPVRCIVDDTSFRDPVYVFPRGSECILGGTAEKGREDLDEDLRTRRRILSRCGKLDPAVKACTFLRPVVGVRPGRREVRVEAERDSTGLVVIHNYGHGGSGFTLAGGCADEVARLLSS